MMIPYGQQTIDQADIEAVTRAMQSSWLTTGPKVTEFETAFADYVGAKYAVAVNSGTAALHLAMLAAGIGPGDRVVTSPNTFLASANCAAYVGATPDFCDIEPVTYNLCPQQLQQTWQSDTKAVVAVDYAGQTADLPAIASVARKHGAIVIEDACHALGGSFEHDGKKWKVGGHPWADITTFSFHPVKTMTTGEGGMLATDNQEYAEKARILRTHGINRFPESFQGLGDGLGDGLAEPAFAEQGPWYYEMQELGFNFRITDLQCALGISQLQRLDQFVSRRREIVANYNEAFESVEAIEIPQLRNPNDLDLTAWHLYTVQIEFESIGMTRTEFMNGLRTQGIGTQVLYIPVHLQPWYRRTYRYDHGKCPVAEDNYRKTISFPLYPSMAPEDVECVIKAVESLVPTTV